MSASIRTTTESVSNRVSTVQLDSHLPSVLSDKIDELIEKFTSGSMIAYDASSAADIFIRVMIGSLLEQNQRNLPLVREGLYRLLKLNIPEVQLKVIQHLKLLLRLELLRYDVENNQSQELIALERQISEVMTRCDRSNLPDLFLSLADLYQDILERLWLLPYLVETRSSYSLIIEQHGPVLINEAAVWQGIIEREGPTRKEFTAALGSLPMMLQRVCAFSPKFSESIKKLKSELNSPLISGLVGDICQEIRDFRRAIHHYQESLKSIAYAFKITDSEQQVAVKKLEGLALNQLGTAYRSLGEFRKAIEFHEKHLQIAKDIRDRAREARAYGNLGTAYDSLGEFRKAIEFHEKHLQIAKDIGDQAGEARAYGNLGIAYDSLGEIRKAIESYEKSLQ
ncbi:MAG: tetratricopeptide repeat protein, partial [Rhabdochlamydiaceae bacterium]